MVEPIGSAMNFDETTITLEKQNAANFRSKDEQTDIAFEGLVDLGTKIVYFLS